MSHLGVRIPLEALLRAIEQMRELAKGATYLRWHKTRYLARVTSRANMIGKYAIDANSNRRAR
jgi:hypothetical protein